MTVNLAGSTIAMPKTKAGTMWDRYNVIASCGRIGERTLRIPKRPMALGVFFISGVLFLIFFGLWVATDQISTWQWTEFLGGESQASLEDLSMTAIGTAGFALLFLRVALYFISAVPTLMEILAPYFADQDDLLAAIFVAFSAFDFYTDWPKAAEVASMGDFAGWGALAGMGEWIWTVVLAFFFSLIVQYIMILLCWIWITSAWNMIFGPKN
jgi:hypothetical protein